MKNIPQIKNYKGYDTLFIDGKPFVVLGGEIHNSSASDAGYMEREVWPYLRDLNLNSLIVPVYWECIEPQRDSFDFSTIETLLTQARRENMKLVLLWFGLWKNAESNYVPGWVKEDRETYFLCRKFNGEPVNTISPFCEQAVKRDKNAFARLLRYIRQKDEDEQTVIMVQIENEIGLLGTERDYCAAANESFMQAVPETVGKRLGVRGTWPQAFGPDGGEYLMAWQFASAVEQIACAGKEEYPLPMYVNAWLEQFPWRGGTYPSGGPVMKVESIWKEAAPSLFTLAPDIYVPYVPQVMEEYARNGNPLFVPEVRKDAVAASYAMYAVLGCHGIGFSPFGIEELRMDSDKIEKVPADVMAALNIDPSAFDIEGSADYLKAAYDVINQLLPMYYEQRESKSVQSFIRRENQELGAVLHFSEYDIQINYGARERFKPQSAGVIFEAAPNEFYIAGMMSSIRFLPKMGVHAAVEAVRLEEGRFEQGTWVRERILNGDERMRIQLKDMPRIFRVLVTSLS